MRGRKMTDLELATITAPASLHPHPLGLYDCWMLDFALFMLESDPRDSKRSIYKEMFSRHDSVTLDFGVERDYMAGLSQLEELARVAGYTLALSYSTRTSSRCSTRR